MTGQRPLGSYGPAERCRLLMNRAGDLNEGRILADDSLPVPDTRGKAAPGAYLYISEILLRASKQQRSAWDFLCLVSLETSGSEAGGNRIHVIGPGAIRSHASVVPAGLLIREMAVAAAPSPESRLTAAVFRVPRTPDSRRVVTAIERLAASLEYDSDPKGSTAVASSIADRLDLLLRFPETSMVAGGSRQGADGVAHFHLAFFPPAGSVPERVFQVRDSSLWAGHSQVSASPWREQEFLLLRVGPRADRSDALRSIDELRRLHAVTQTIDVETGAGDQERYGEKIARMRLVSRLSTRFGREGMARIPLVTPIAVEAAADLRPILMSGAAELHPVFAQQLAEMRSHLRNVLGFEVPAARIRMNDSDLPAGSYLFNFHEVPLVMGTVQIGRGLCAATVEEVSRFGIKAEPATNPASGNESSWVAETDWPRLADAGLTVWSPGEYIILHLSACIRKNLSEFVTLQAVGSLLKAKSKEQYEEIRVPGELPRFTSVIQALLAEEVSVRDLDAVCRRYMEQRHLPAYEIVEEIRALDQIRVSLAGNAPDTPVFRLGERFTAVMREGILRDGEATVLALEPEPTQEALSAVRTEVGSLPPASKNPVLFVEDWRMRPFVRKLVELEFPYLWTLSRREAISPDSMPVIATIEFEEPKPRSVKR